ncbi:hypothetical protein HMPREF1705_04689 [Acetomicrobium hydrogeniformans ATCC BAA-1850]|uniref:Uncharacterized protein n=1 Tax=Acetomicrobium hydrogeniformans ATCC BAA-1850 TaxID=592015 RepID=A0A0T5X8F0_9BACT|nr:hypothetical protein HMPREF1705_04689 [Acetomicrobium hydrogeniformans ATCC BAA-1850]
MCYFWGVIKNIASDSFFSYRESLKSALRNLIILKQIVKNSLLYYNRKKLMFAKGSRFPLWQLQV